MTRETAVTGSPTSRNRTKEIGWPLEPSRAGFLPDSVQRWTAFKETNPQLNKFRKKYSTGLISNIDDKLLGVSRRHLRTDLELVVTAQQVRSYKPDPAHFKECARRIGPMKKNWIVTDETWRLYPTWSPTLLLADPRGIAWERPRILGRPPLVGRREDEDCLG